MSEPPGPRIGFLGCGLIAAYHAGMLRSPDGSHRIVAAFDPDRDRAAAFAAAHGATVCASEAEVIEASDAVYVATWTSEHRRLVEAAAGAGRAVFCEKPLAATLADAEAMAAAVAAAGVVSQVGLVLRDSPSFGLLRHLVQRPESGRLMSIVFRDDQYLPTQGMYRSSWRGDVARAGAGTLLEHSIHDLDLLRWIAGPVASLSARTAHFHELDGIEDVATVSLAFASGALATLTSVWHDVLARPSMRHVEVFCERATYVLEGDVFGPVRWTVEGDGGAFTGSGAVEGPDLVEARRSAGLAPRNPDLAFVAAVAAGTPATPDLAAALPAHAAADAAYRSAAAGGAPVDLD
jgi:1,5-anhydro-D-fructose reductase (1,5-anhydro-D-mannitol-forming)